MVIHILEVVVAIGILTVLHELGHFVPAKIFGVKVEVFSVGFGPKLISRVWGETEYRISLIPFGAYVKMAGENQTEGKILEKGDFFAQKIWRRAIMLISGVVVNVLLCCLIFIFIFYAGRPVLKAVIGEVKEGEPAALAGLSVGDRIINVNGVNIEDWDTVYEITSKSPNKPLVFQVEKDNQIKTVEITPRLEIETTPFNDKVERGLIGVLPDADQIYYKKEPFLKAILKGTQQTFYLAKLMYIGLWKIATLKISVKQLGGPLLAAQLAVQQVQLGFLPLLMFLAVISLNLAVINLLPIPVLDGGHLLFLLIEKIKGRPLSVKAQEIGNTLGLVILVTIMLLATYNDILRFFEK